MLALPLLPGGRFRALTNRKQMPCIAICVAKQAWRIGCWWPEVCIPASGVARGLAYPVALRSRSLSPPVPLYVLRFLQRRRFDVGPGHSRGPGYGQFQGGS